MMLFIEFMLPVAFGSAAGLVLGHLLLIKLEKEDCHDA